jgi:hypothetical protein
MTVSTESNACDPERTAAVERALFQSAAGGSVRAQVFWLVNRWPERWRSVRGIRVAPRVPSFAELARFAREAYSWKGQAEKLLALYARLGG